MNQKMYWFMVALGFSAIISLVATPFTQRTTAIEVDVVLPTQTVAPSVKPDSTLIPEQSTPVPSTCLDCGGDALTDEETLLLICSPESLEENPEYLAACYEDEWIWSCDPDGWCEFDGEDDPTGEGYDW